MPEFYLRHTYYTKVVALNAMHAQQASLDIVEEVKEQLENIGVEIVEIQQQKLWELSAQQRLQEGV